MEVEVLTMTIIILLVAMLRIIGRAVKRFVNTFVWHSFLTWLAVHHIHTKPLIQGVVFQTF